MPPDFNLLRRQIWATPTATTTSIPRTCSPFRLPSGGLLSIGNSTVTITDLAVFQPACIGVPTPNSTPPQADSHVFDDQLPFYSSTSPQIYAIAASTVISYMLVIILFITPRTLFAGGVGGGGGFLGHKGMISRASGSTSVIGAEGRPWLQKAAALSVAVSLTYASVDTFTVAQAQYNNGYQDALALTDSVVKGTATKVIRLISDIFVWLAQAQTLIKLFPRHREKIVIEWTGLVLITLDAIFSALNCFLYESAKVRPRNFDDAIPALSYLFSSALGVIYATMVMFYSFQKGRFAYFHPKMRNICLLAAISLIAVLIPLVFFILDIAKPDVAGWGHYARWVGSAAASVVVWEWVERIEALEAEERKDGILGREIFDGDEMLEVSPSSEISWPKACRNNQGGQGDGGRPGGGRSTGWDRTATPLSRLPRSRQAVQINRNSGRISRNRNALGQEIQVGGIETGANCSPRPSPVTSPINRADTTSATVSIQTMSNHTISDSGLPRHEQPEPHSDCSGKDQHQHENRNRGGTSRVKSFFNRWSIWSSLFGQGRTTPPPEVSQGLSKTSEPSASTHNTQIQPKASYFSTLGRLRGNKTTKSGNAPVPVIIIPAPPPSGRTSFIGTRSTPDVEERIDSPESSGWDATNRGTHHPLDAARHSPENAQQSTSVPGPSSSHYSPVNPHSPISMPRGSVTFSEDYRTNAAQAQRTSMGIPRDGNASSPPPQSHQGLTMSGYSPHPVPNVLASPELPVRGTGRLRQDEE